MNGPIKNYSKVSWRRFGWFRAWLATIAATFFILLTVFLFIPGGWRGSFEGWFEVIFATFVESLIVATGVVGLWAFVRWICHWRNLRRFVFGLACFVTLVALFYAEEDWRGKHDWDQFKRQWGAKGESFEPDSVMPKGVPDDENFAMSPVWIAGLKYSESKCAKAWYGDRTQSAAVSNDFRLMPLSVSDVVGTNWGWCLPETPDTFGNWPIARLSDLRSWQEFYRNLEATNPAADIAVTPRPQSPAQDVLLALSKYDPLIAQLHRDSERPHSRFPIEYDTPDPGVILLPHLSAVKSWARVLELRAEAELQSGQSDKALEDVHVMLRLVDATRDEPFLISHLVRLAVLPVALQPIYEGLASHQWSDAQLADLDSSLAAFDFLKDYRFALRGEMVLCDDGFLDYARRNPGQVFNITTFGGGNPPATVRMMADLIPEGWFYQNEFHCDRAMEEYYLPVADTNRDIISPSSVRRAAAAVEAETRHANPYDILERMTLPNLLPSAMRFAYGQNSVNLARVAIALERYRLAHGAYPDTPKGLAPQFIAFVPHDIINGQPLHYRRTAGGQFILYSVGWNETDDGGVVVFKKGSTGAVDLEQGDWVWRYPER